MGGLYTSSAQIAYVLNTWLAEGLLFCLWFLNIKDNGDVMRLVPCKFRLHS